jgi:hypothetical protein
MCAEYRVTYVSGRTSPKRNPKIALATGPFVCTANRFTTCHEVLAGGAQHEASRTSSRRTTTREEPSRLFGEGQSSNYARSSGRLTRTPPHTMFYAPFLSNADIGGLPDKTAFVDRPGPHGMIIVIAGQKEREALFAASQALVDEIERIIGLK